MYPDRLCRQASYLSAIVQRRRLLDIRCSKSSSSSTPWQYTNLPWSRNNLSASKADSVLKQENEVKKKKLKQLEKAVRVVVQQHLFEKHANLFRGTTMKELNQLQQQQKQQQQPPPQTQGDIAVEHSAFEKLALLNGFQMVDTPTREERVPLAEGIVARAGYYNRIRQGGRIKYTLYSQPIVVDNQHHYHRHQAAASAAASSNVMEHLPPLVEPDITIYRILESRVEDWLNAWRVALRTRVQSLLRWVAEPVQKSNNNSKETHEMSACIVPSQQKNEEQEENLLVVTDHNLVLVTQMRPSLRLLALPHELGHKSASTLISVSIVVFGAIPVAYRSFNFALAYPGLATVIKASVIGTILYGIWSTRSIARTSQSQVVAKGLARRVFARDDAVVLVLQNGAIQRVTEAVLDVYLQDSNKIGVLASKRHVLPANLVDPVEIAMNLGLVEKAKNDVKYKWTKPALDDAIAKVKRHPTYWSM